MPKWVAWVTLAANMLMASAAGFGAWFAWKGLEAYRDAKAKEVRERADSAYSKASEGYRDYLHLCLEHPSADAFELARSDTGSENEYRQLVALEVLMTAMETAFVEYDKTDPKTRAKQWDDDWGPYIDAWTKDARFQKAWLRLGTQFDHKFTDHVNQRIKMIAGTELPAPH